MATKRYTVADYWKYDPLRRLARRGERAGELAARGLRPSRYDDADIRRYRNFLLFLEAAGTDVAQLAALREQLPDIYDAHQLCFDADAETRIKLEAWLLTTESDDKIAKRFGTAPAVVHAYESLFFNVRDSLRSSDWIYLVALRPQLDRRLGVDEAATCDGWGRVFRVVAYYGGPIALDVLLGGGAPNRTPCNADDLAVWIDAARTDQIRRLAMAAAIHLDPTNCDVVRLQKLMQKLPASANKEYPYSAAEKAIQAFLDGTDWDALMQAAEAAKKSPPK